MPLASLGDSIRSFTDAFNSFFDNLAHIHWLPLLIGISVVGGAIGSNYHTDFNLPNSDSKVVQDALTKGGNKEDAGWTAQIVFTSPNGTAPPAGIGTSTSRAIEMGSLRRSRG